MFGYTFVLYQEGMLPQGDTFTAFMSRDLFRFLLYFLLNTATIRAAGQSEVPWSIKDQVNKEKPLCHVLGLFAESQNPAVSRY